MKYQAILAASAIAQVSAHLPYVELERARKSASVGFQAGPPGPAIPGVPVNPNPEDLSLAFPFDIVQESRVPDWSFDYTIERPVNKGEIRPDMSLYLESMLHDETDVDYFVYKHSQATQDTLNRNKYGEEGKKAEDTEAPWVAYAYPIVPVCEAYRTIYPSVAFMGPLTTIDQRTGEAIFKKVSEVYPEGAPFEVPTQVTDEQGNIVEYGVRVLTQDENQIITKEGPNKGEPLGRQTYFAPEAQTAWWLPYGWPNRCIDGWKDDTTDCLKPELDYFKNVIFHEITQFGDYYFAIFDPTPADEITLKQRDVAIVVGANDDFRTLDWVRLDGMQALVSAGRSISNECVNPDTVAPIEVDDEEEQQEEQEETVETKEGDSVNGVAYAAGGAAGGAVVAGAAAFFLLGSRKPSAEVDSFSEHRV